MIRAIVPAVLFAVAVAAAPPSVAQGQSVRLVACAPGYPGTAEQAQPLMDAFASAVAGKTGLVLEARYEPGMDPGLELLAENETALALVPLSFYLEHRERAALIPLLSVAYETGATERWSLVAAKGRVANAEALGGWIVSGTPGYSVDFVRRVALSDWELLPSTVRIRPTARVLSELRKAAKGEDVAVLLDRAQAEALPKLPFATELEVIVRSAEMPAYVLCEVGGRLAPGVRKLLVENWIELHRDDAVQPAMSGIRIDRFLPLEIEGLKKAERQFVAAP